MMENNLRELYQQVILDHNKNPKNFRKIENATHYSEGFNPLCGDHIDIFLKLENEIIKDISFQGQGCAISKSSASVMTTILKGKSIEEAENLFKIFHDLVTGKNDIDSNSSKNDLHFQLIEMDDELLKLKVFQGVKEFPARVKCASLAWHTFYNALKNKNNIITTE